MRRDILQFGLILILLLLLGVLAWLQYEWQGRISDAEKVRLEKRVRDDSRRFASEFDEQIQRSVFYQDFSETGVLEDDGVRFIKRFIDWENRSNQSGIISAVYSIQGETVSKFQPGKRSFEKAEFPKAAASLRKWIKRDEFSVKKSSNFILVPILEEKESVTEVHLSSSDKFETVEREEIMGRSKVVAYGLVELDTAKLIEKILEPLYQKYFAGENGVGFQAAVYGSKDQLVWASSGDGIEKGDHESRLFTMRPRNFFIIDSRSSSSARLDQNQSKKRVVFSEVFRSRVETTSDSGTVDFEFKPKVTKSPDSIALISSSRTSEKDWKLRIRHESGSLQNFVSSTRNKNLMISFGILSILALGLIAIVLTSRRARVLAQRQVDFVSSVSHEFRTPLAVIYSAAERTFLTASLEILKNFVTTAV